jgi:hypothetical protein
VLCALAAPLHAATICLPAPQGSGFVNQQGQADPGCAAPAIPASAGAAPTRRQVLPLTLEDAAPLPAPSAQAWTVKPGHHSLQQVIEDWAATAGYEVHFKTRDFPMVVKSEKVISTGDFWSALTVLGEAYRNSDAPFQVQPTDFKQIVIYPMRTPKSAALP